ncbi:hypothetical protein [Pararhodobacter marinus]|uniref:hypothetical protein n=1 Tax=Pararhodobacter marinus TaxID=2184063 RepID=UPI00143E0CA5|nr:hypothetical protein [Pararhodobacter marinus]
MQAQKFAECGVSSQQIFAKYQEFDGSCAEGDGFANPPPPFFAARAIATQL